MSVIFGHVPMLSYCKHRELQHALDLKTEELARNAADLQTMRSNHSGLMVCECMDRI